MHWGDNISTCGGITSVQWGDNISTVEGIQYSGVRILISACSGHEKILIFFVLRYEPSFGSFSKIQTDFMHFESWTAWCTPGPTLFRNNLQFYFPSALSVF